MIELQVRLFGALRSYGPVNGIVKVQIPAGCRAANLREMVAQALAPGDEELMALLRESAVADDRSVLADDVVLDPAKGVALLPPVCGG